MISITYFAKRSLKVGVTAGDEITISFNATQYEPLINAEKDTTKALNGSKQTTLHNYLKGWSITAYRTNNLTKADFDQFLNSVIGGEIFVVTDYDDGLDYAVVLTGSYQMSRITNFNQGDFQYSFTCEEQPS